MAGILAVVGDSESADATMSPSPREGFQTTISLIAPVPLLVWMLCTTGFFYTLGSGGETCCLPLALKSCPNRRDGMSARRL